MNETNNNFDDLYAKALAAGEAAGVAWELRADSGTAHKIVDHSLIGSAYVKILPADSAFGQWLKQTYDLRCLYCQGGGYALLIGPYDERVEKLKSQAEATTAVLIEAGIDASVHFKFSDPKNTTKEVTLGMTRSSISSAEIRSDGYLVVERYDSDSDSDRWFGNDVSSAVMVSTSDKDKVLSLLNATRTTKSYPSDEDELLLVLLRENFKSHREVKAWFEANKIPYTRKFDAHA